MQIIRLKPVFKQMIWGGSRMREKFGYDIPGDDTGECWAVSAHQNGDCTVCGTEFDGMPLSKLWEEHNGLFGNAAERLNAGKHDGYPVFPLLTKIIDARQNLSIQVHPDDEYATRHENGSLGKTECWYILDCDPGATIIIGHNAKTHEELEDMIREGKWDAFIREIPIHKGDFLQINPGTVHAIKAGTMILETQQNSDITYRVYDYGRLQNGKARQLHIEQSIDVIKVPFTNDEVSECGSGLTAAPGRYSEISKKSCSPLIKCSYYSVVKLEIEEKAAYIQDKPFLICSVIDGGGSILGEDGHEEIIGKGDHFILPAGYGSFEINGTMSLICSSVI